MSLQALQSRKKRRIEESSLPESKPFDSQPSSKRSKSTTPCRKNETKAERDGNPQPPTSHGTLSNLPGTPDQLELNGTNPKSHLRINEETGDLFASPPTSLLVHSCNCEGSWGGGIAKAFKSQFPAAYQTYAQHCASAASTEALVGSALLIPPPPQSKGSKSSGDGESEDGQFVGCLFTSRSKGRKKDSKAQILGATASAMRDLMRAVREWNERSELRVGEVRMCKINSGLFGVPWAETRAVLEEIEPEGFDVVTVVSMS